MIKILIYSFFFFVKKDKNLMLSCSNSNSHTLNNSNVENNIFKKNYISGLDMRFGVINTTNENELNRIKKHFYNKKLLSILQDKSISDFEKICIINQNNILGDTMDTDVKCAGLFDDWNFKI